MKTNSEYVDIISRSTTEEELENVMENSKVGALRSSYMSLSACSIFNSSKFTIRVKAYLEEKKLKL